MDKSSTKRSFIMCDGRSPGVIKSRIWWKVSKERLLCKGWDYFM